MGKYELKWYGEKAKDLAKMVTAKALVECAAHLQEKSLEQVPWATGDLGGSCNISPVNEDGNRIWLTVGYNTPYAIKQHEDLTLRHPDPRNPLSVPGRKAKYLEDPFNENAEKYKRHIEKSVKNALKASD